MPLERTQVDLETAAAELDAQLDEIAEEVARIDPGERDSDNDEFVALRQRATELEKQLGGIEWLIDEYGADATVTVTGLTARETAVVGDRIRDLESETLTPTKSVESMSQVIWVAEGLEAAPFLEDGGDFEAAFAAVGGLPRQVLDWLDDQISELSTVGDREGNSFAQRVAAKTETSPETSR